MSYTNADGLSVLTNGAAGVAAGAGTSAKSVRQTLVWDLADATALATSAAAPAANDPFIPANAFITNAWFVVDDAFTSGGSGTLGLGLYTAAGATIDVDGIDAAIAKTALDADMGVVCDGALVDGTENVGAANAYVGALYATAAFTAGSGKLVIEYINVL
jgi:hypothetical protein